MSTFLATFGAMLLVFGLMSVGYLFKKKAISGSCGGLAGVGIDKECDCPEPCDRRKAKMAKEAAEAERRERLAQHRIL
ncbi:(Na+)-NQR maturation NqrM [Ferrimonas balearica]|uniref:(Na+)-NQR maturation NqrM n=1 Tax=Ferrimonas balearica TaxID=44012 RepID=UPI001C58877D|nr:(Na+)-NQR maturation NqrM [Ferrimonas balearica]MBW3138008.1 (Na+)-NQR maturation NqrM [Ferrimonas balearica]